MEIKNTTIMEEKLFAGFQRFSGRLFKKSNTANLIWNIFFIFILTLCVIIIALAMVFIAMLGGDIIPFLCFFPIIIFLVGITVFTKIFLPKIMYKKSPLKGSAHYYTFKDEEFSVEAKSDKIETNETLKYSSIVKAYETAGEMFLYISPYQAMVVSKYGFTSENDIKTVREKLVSLLQDKYITVK